MVAQEAAQRTVFQRTPIEEITPRSIRTSAREHAIDSLTFAPGFDAFSGSLFQMNIRGRGGKRLQDHWSAGPRTVRGIGTHYFPNLFIVTRPQSAVFFNLARNIKQHVDWIAKCIAHLRANDYAAIEATTAGEEHWTTRVRQAADATLLPATDSWWVRAHIPGKPRVILR